MVLGLGLVTGFPVWVRLGQHIRLVSFFVLFRFVVFLHSLCSVVVSYFMLIPAFVILLFSVTVFSACING